MDVERHKYVGSSVIICEPVYGGHLVGVRGVIKGFCNDSFIIELDGTNSVASFERDDFLIVDDDC
jgi:hypothetical protein